MNISSDLYNPTFNYDPATNSYLRWQAGSNHSDRETKKVINPKVVIVIKTKTGIVDSQGHLDIVTIGSGEATVFQDGIQTPAKWSKDSDKSEIRILDLNGSPLALNKGQIWFVSIAPEKKITVL